VAINALRVAYWDDNIQSAKDDPCIVDAMTDWAIRQVKALPPAQPEIIYCKDCKHHWTHKCMDSFPIERCDLEQTLYDAEHDFCSLAERREETT
jgi:hypothetical protein